MKIKKLDIKNFRGIKSASIDIEDFTTLIGPNNIGKSTILHALHILLDNKKPTIDDWPNKTHSEEDMEIICTFSKIEEWEKKKPAISGLLFNNELIVKMSARWIKESDSIAHEYSVYRRSKKYPHTGLGIQDARKKPEILKCLEKLGIKNADDYKKLQHKIDDYFDETSPETIEHTTGWVIKNFPNSLQQAIPHVMYLPACFKIEDDLKTNNNTPFSFLFSNKLFPCVKNDETYKEYINKADILQKKT